MLFNVTQNKPVMGKVRVANNPYSQTKGLMFESAKKFDYALVFPLLTESRIGSSLHMFFVFFPIDVLFLDSRRKVVDIAKGVKPFTPLYLPKKPSRYFIEMPAGKADGVKIGDEIKW